MGEKQARGGMDVDRQIFERARALSTLTKLRVQVMDAGGQVLDQAGDTSEYCRIFSKYLPEGETCEKLHMLASRRAVDIGEAYLFTCHSSVCHIVLPRLSGDEFDGAVLLGPFLIGELDSVLLADVCKRYPMPADALLDMFEAAGRLPQFSAEETRALCKLVYDLFGGSEGLSDKLKRAQQQRLIGESIQTYKGFENSVIEYPYEKERALAAHVKEGDITNARKVLNDLLGFALFQSNGELETIKSCTAELCVLLSRAAMEVSAEHERMLNINRAFMRTLWQARTIEDLCYFMQEAVERFCQCVFPQQGVGEREMVQRAIRYINLNYMERVTLCDLAREVHLSEAYFSTIFKRGYGTSFREYLNAVRIDHAKRLLQHGGMTVTEIALSVGFESQSYFSKAFHAATGESPKGYRKRVREASGAYSATRP